MDTTVAAILARFKYLVVIFLRQQGISIPVEALPFWRESYRQAAQLYVQHYSNPRARLEVTKLIRRHARELASVTTTAPAFLTTPAAQPRVASPAPAVTEVDSDSESAALTQALLNSTLTLGMHGLARPS